jgi:hypothetical protein
MVRKRARRSRVTAIENLCTRAHGKPSRYVKEEGEYPDNVKAVFTVVSLPSPGADTKTQSRRGPGTLPLVHRSVGRIVSRHTSHGHPMGRLVQRNLLEPSGMQRNWRARWGGLRRQQIVETLVIAAGKRITT